MLYISSNSMISRLCRVALTITLNSQGHQATESCGQEKLRHFWKVMVVAAALQLHQLKTQKKNSGTNVVLPVTPFPVALYVAEPLTRFRRFESIRFVKGCRSFQVPSFNLVGPRRRGATFEQQEDVSCNVDHHNQQRYHEHHQAFVM